MGKCYCDYCDVFLTNDSVAVRKQHNEGNRHKHNVCEYYRQYVGQQLQEEIDEIVAAFELKVAQGLIRPTYGLPPATKTQQQQAPRQPPTEPPALTTQAQQASNGDENNMSTDNQQH